MVCVKKRLSAAAMADFPLLNATFHTLKSVPLKNRYFPCCILPVRTSQPITRGNSPLPVASQFTCALGKSVSYFGVMLWCANMPLETLGARRPLNPKLLQSGKYNSFAYAIFFSDPSHAHFRNSPLHFLARRIKALFRTWRMFAPLYAVRPHAKIHSACCHPIHGGDSRRWILLHELLHLFPIYPLPVFHESLPGRSHQANYDLTEDS